MSETKLSLEQEYAYALFCEGENLFITGPGGTGKTLLISYMVEQCKKVGKTCQVTALTGCATTLLPDNCNARTIHSFSGGKLFRGEKEKIIQGILRKKVNRQNWRKTDVLIVDEVSMMSKKMFEILEEAARTIRLSQIPFGGIQVIFLGDFLQLPPVPNQNEKDSGKFCFETRLWEKVFPLKNNIELKTIFRQKDPIYQSILLEIRKGSLGDKNIEILNKCLHREMDKNDTISKLFPVRYKSEAINERKFGELPGNAYTFQIQIKKNWKTNIDNGKPLSIEDMLKCDNMSEYEREYEVRNLISCSNFQEELQLKIGTMVMCTVNLDMDRNIFNGSQGKVVDFIRVNNEPRPVVLFNNGTTKLMDLQHRQSDEYPSLVVSQIPLCLAWAMTIHKIQGASLEKAEMDIGQSIFEYGQSYVALSRIISLEGLYLSAFKHENIRANPVALSYYKELLCIDYEKELKKRKMHSKNDILQEEHYEEKEEKSVFLKNLDITDKIVSSPKKKESTYDKTWQLYQENKTIAEIAELRGLKKNTVLQHFTEILPNNQVNMEDLMSKDIYEKIKNVFDELGNISANAIKEQLPWSISYMEIKLVRLIMYGKENETKTINL